MDKYNELKQEIDTLKAEINKQNNKMIYNYIDDNMPTWAHEAVQWCVDKGIIAGTGDGLGLDDMKLWVCVVLYRVARFIGKLIGVKV